MQQKNKQEEHKSTGQEYTKYTGPGHGQQGVDKAPGEEENTDNVQFTQETQKATKNDGDPSDPKDQPGEENI